jgi:CTP synthase
MCKYIVTVGGVHSGCGKGVASASIGLLLSMRGLSVKAIKCDPYFNANAGVLAPREHGEVFLCEDGTEADLDLGTYERIIGTQMSYQNILTSGTLFKELIAGEEQGKYLGQTVQTIPHVTDLIQERLVSLGKDANIVMIEIGGTVGDIESVPFLRAIRQFKQRNWDDVMICLVAPVLWINIIKEFKTKPLQMAVETLNSYGLQPDLLLCRPINAPIPLPPKILDKIANLTNIPRTAMFAAPDVRSVWEVPIEYYNRHVDDLICDKFHLKRNGVKIHKYRELVERYLDAHELPEVTVAIVGKYDNEEAYTSLKEAVLHAGVANNCRVQIKWVQAEDLEKAKDMRGVWPHFDDVDAVIVPGGFDKRGVEGKIRAVKYARDKKIPFLGICLGLQCAVIEIARLAGLDNANSREFDPQTKYPVINLVKGQEEVTQMSGTMRLGAYDCEVKPDSLAMEVYGKKLISERHRHRYEVNPTYLDQLAAKGFRVTGTNPESGLVEIMEMDRAVHPYFTGTQAHPEFKSRLTAPSPLFVGLVAKAMERMQSKEAGAAKETNELQRILA